MHAACPQTAPKFRGQCQGGPCMGAQKCTWRTQHDIEELQPCIMALGKQCITSCAAQESWRGAFSENMLYPLFSRWCTCNNMGAVFMQLMAPRRGWLEMMDLCHDCIRGTKLAPSKLHHKCHAQDERQEDGRSKEGRTSSLLRSQTGLQTLLLVPRPPYGVQRWHGDQGGWLRRVWRAAPQLLQSKPCGLWQVRLVTLPKETIQVAACAQQHVLPRG